jgi:hypothetical protein
VRHVGQLVGEPLHQGGESAPVGVGPAVEGALEQVRARLSISRSLCRPWSVAVSRTLSPT